MRLFIAGVIMFIGIFIPAPSYSDVLEELSNYPMIYNTSAQDVCVNNEKIYVADGDAGIKIFDISDPEYPIVVGSYYNSKRARSVVVLDDKLIAAFNYPSSLEIIDVSNIGQPQYYSSCTFTSSHHINGMSISNGKGILTHGYGIDTVDLADLGNPIWVGTITADPMFGAMIVGDIAYVANGLQGLRIYNISELAVPQFLGCYINYRTFKNVVVANNRAYCSLQNAPSIILNVANPENPRDQLPFKNTVSQDNVVSAGKVYSIGIGLRVFDLADPDEPKMIANNDDAIVIGTYGSAIDIENENIVTVCVNKGMAIWRLSPPTVTITPVDSQTSTMTTTMTNTKTITVTLTPTISKTNTPTKIVPPTLTKTPTVTRTQSVTETPTSMPLFPRGGYAIPNPFVPHVGKQVTFIFEMGNPLASYSISIMDLKGRIVKRLENKKTWDGRSDNGHLCEGGVYIYQIEAEGKRVTGKVVLVK
ncbi:T9SS type A sorting domain-containing protein [bacterium]|nr:T9SS type A sorting domain-containing protein [bacterium]